MASKTIGVYVPSCGRWDRIKTYHALDGCRYVVRESEKDRYFAAGLDRRRVLAVEDSLIASLPMTRQYILDNSKEDIVVQIDDDVQGFVYKNHNNLIRIGSDEAWMEIYRMAQILDDLGLGFASVDQTIDVRKYSQEFKFKGLCGIMNIYNKEFLKGKCDTANRIKCDIDFELQELLKNRIVILSGYFTVDAVQDKNAGGANLNKTKEYILSVVDYLKTKWGRYIDFNYLKNTTKVNVKR